jgi:hypothetical protein
MGADAMGGWIGMLAFLGLAALNIAMLWHGRERLLRALGGAPRARAMPRSLPPGESNVIAFPAAAVRRPGAPRVRLAA